MSEEESNTFTLSEIRGVLETVFGFRVGDIEVASHFLNLRKSLPKESLIMLVRSIKYDDVALKNVSIIRVSMDGVRYKARGLVSDFIIIDNQNRALVIDGRIKALNDNDYVIVHESKESISETRFGGLRQELLCLDERTPREGRPEAEDRGKVARADRQDHTSRGPT